MTITFQHDPYGAVLGMPAAWAGGAVEQFNRDRAEARQWAQPFMLQQQRAALEADLSQTQLTQQETLRLQRLQNQLGEVLASPLNDDEKAMLRLQIMTGINPLVQRQQNAQMQMQQAQMQQMQQHLRMQQQTEDEINRFRAQTMPNGLGRLPDPDRPGQYLPGWYQIDHNGMRHRVIDPIAEQAHQAHIDLQRAQVDAINRRPDPQQIRHETLRQVMDNVENHMSQEIQRAEPGRAPAWAATAQSRDEEFRRRVQVRMALHNEFMGPAASGGHVPLPDQTRTNLSDISATIRQLEGNVQGMTPVQRQALGQNLWIYAQNLGRYGSLDRFPPDARRQADEAIRLLRQSPLGNGAAAAAQPQPRQPVPPVGPDLARQAQNLGLQ